MSTAAKLDKRVTIQRPAIGDNAAGEPLNEWVNVIADGDGKLWASITDMSGSQFFAAAATQNAVQTTIVIRYRVGISPDMRVLYRDDVYNIESVLGQDGRLLQLMCSRGVTDG